MIEQEIKTNEFKGIKCVAFHALMKVEPIATKLDLVMAGNSAKETNPTLQHAYLKAYPNGFEDRYPEIKIDDILLLLPGTQPIDVTILFKGLDKETDEEIAKGVKYAFFDMHTIMGTNKQERHLKEK